MGTVEIVLGIILLVAAVFLIIAVLMQQGKSKGMSGAIGGGTADTFFGKTKGKSADKMLSKLTTIVGIAFVVIVLTVYIIQDEADYTEYFESHKAELENPVETEETTKSDESTTSTPESTSESTPESSSETTAA